MKILIKFNKKYYPILNSSKRDKKGSFVISGFPTRKYSNIHVTFSCDGHHHLSFIRKDRGKIMVFDDIPYLYFLSRKF